MLIRQMPSQQSEQHRIVSGWKCNTKASKQNENGLCMFNELNDLLIVLTMHVADYVN